VDVLKATDTDIAINASRDGVTQTLKAASGPPPRCSKEEKQLMQLHRRYIAVAIAVIAIASFVLLCFSIRSRPAYLLNSIPLIAAEPSFLQHVAGVNIPSSPTAIFLATGKYSEAGFKKTIESLHGECKSTHGSSVSSHDVVRVDATPSGVPLKAIHPSVFFMHEREKGAQLQFGQAAVFMSESFECGNEAELVYRVVTKGVVRDVACAFIWHPFSGHWEFTKLNVIDVFPENKGAVE
jgi:hypothetical protein